MLLSVSRLGLLTRSSGNKSIGERLDDIRPRKRHTDCEHKSHSVGAPRLNMDHRGTVVPFLGNACNAREASNGSVSGSGNRSTNAICLSRENINRPDTEEKLSKHEYENRFRELRHRFKMVTAAKTVTPTRFFVRRRTYTDSRRIRQHTAQLLKINFPCCRAIDISLFRAAIMAVFFFYPSDRQFSSDSGGRADRSALPPYKL